ncbi:hypothetical protein DPMN_007211 [Dreissena polymorpha]|uniref:Uncharacterized protein n=1 Tax=Dreissena polymorpha TaxID=45954 RepID=A0A9D4MY33_DREPO|nr:hypothetical protein DPMN_007211 [Dreissena polymorpha]
MSGVFTGYGKTILFVECRPDLERNSSMLQVVQVGNTNLAFHKSCDDDDNDDDQMMISPNLMAQTWLA